MTSVIGVDTTGRPPARYSGVLVGEMNLVEFVDRERHQGDVPAAEIGRQLLICLAAEIVDVGPLRQVGGVDLDHRPDHDDRPFGMRVGDAPRAAPGPSARRSRRRSRSAAAAASAWSSGSASIAAGLGEMGAIDARREGMDVGVAALLRLVEAVAAGEDDVGARRAARARGRAARAARSGNWRARPCSRRRCRRPRCAARRAASSACSTSGRTAPARRRESRRAAPSAPPRAHRAARVFGQRRGDHDHAGFGAGANAQRRLAFRQRGLGLFPDRSPDRASANRLIKCCGRWKTKFHRRCEKQIESVAGGGLGREVTLPERGGGG